MDSDIVVIGGGIVGLASAYEIGRRWPNRRIILVEKESQLAFHQTGRNSGVIHSGIYYKPGSLKALNCRTGKKSLEEFCRRESMPMERCGKVIVATDATEERRLEALYLRGTDNGVECERIDRAGLRKIEPHAHGVRAIHVRETGIVDYRAVCERLAELLRTGGHEIRLGVRVLGMERRGHEVRVATSAGDIAARLVINCGGLHSDRIAAMTGEKPECRIVPFRGEYYRLKSDAAQLCRNLIYPVPDPEFPFLGVHFTRMIRGGVECGPNAVLSWAREGYRKTDVNLRDMNELIWNRGFWKMGRTYWRMGVGEYWRSWNKQAFVKALQKLIPDIRSDHLEPAPAGIRAQALSMDGRLVDDFVVRRDSCFIHVINAPSPAATACFGIASHVARLVEG